MQNHAINLPESIKARGYQYLPEWLPYVIKPNALLIYRQLITWRKNDKGKKGFYRRYCDATNEQLAAATGLSRATIDRTLTYMEIKGLISFHTQTKKVDNNYRAERNIYFSSLSKVYDACIYKRTYKECLEKWIKGTDIEWNRINTDEWRNGVPVIHGIIDPIALRVLCVLLGQHLRGVSEIKISARQMAQIVSVKDRETVSAAYKYLEAQGFITITGEKRNRVIKFL